MRVILLTLFLAATAAAMPPPTPVPVVVELFTSEGCSSCPPADAVLSRLGREQSIPGVTVIPLGMHVTYWDHLGWRDASSLQLATERQHNYGRVFGEDRIYTPQAVIDGRSELIGSDAAAMRSAVIKAASERHVRLSLNGRVDGGAVRADAAILDDRQDIKEKLNTWIVITEDDLTSVVKRGENGGRTLHHDAVVRAVFGGELGSGNAFSGSTALNPGWRRDRLHLAAMIQGKSSQRIWGAAQIDLK